MALTAHQLALRMAKHIGVTAFDPGDPSNTTPLHFPGLRDGDIDEIVACINGALQELWDRAPVAVCFARLGIELRAPAQVTLQVTRDSNAITGITGYAAWMDGCTIRLEGDATDNELVDGGTLLRPYLGASSEGGGTVSGTVFADCASPGPEVIGIVDPIGTCGSAHLPALLTRVTSRAEFESYWGIARRTVGMPEVCFVETRYLPARSRLGIRLRVHPMPRDAMLLTYGARLNAPTITAADVGAATDPGTAFPIPGGWEEAVLLPLALQRFSAHPNFAPESAREEIERQAVSARRIMQSAAPQRSPARLLPTFR